MKALFLLLKALKLGPVLTTSGTMLLSMLTYSFLFGWRYSVGFVLLIFFHEMGHFLAARQRGLKVGAPTFIPFVGAWIQMKEIPHDVETEAYVGIAGPVAGTITSVLCYALAREQQSDILMALAYAGFMINLFNLIPMSPLDGGRITAILSPKIWWLGVPILGALFFVNPSPMLILIAILALPQLLSTLRGQNTMPPQYYTVPMETRIHYGLWYLGLTAYLAIMTHDVHQLLTGHAA
jgi:Zn-dependent protease